jgi:hypothetical protein
LKKKLKHELAFYLKHRSLDASNAETNLVRSLTTLPFELFNNEFSSRPD